MLGIGTAPPSPQPPFFGRAGTGAWPAAWGSTQAPCLPSPAGDGLLNHMHWDRRVFQRRPKGMHSIPY
eukprot:5787365-Heterocapsa_arctica.AAC.1